VGINKNVFLKIFFSAIFLSSFYYALAFLGMMAGMLCVGVWSIEIIGSEFNGYVEERCGVREGMSEEVEDGGERGKGGDG
jgi:hypothetical protein